MYDDIEFQMWGRTSYFSFLYEALKPPSPPPLFFHPFLRFTLFLFFFHPHLIYLFLVFILFCLTILTLFHSVTTLFYSIQFN